MCIHKMQATELRGGRASQIAPAALLIARMGSCPKASKLEASHEHLNSWCLIKQA